MLKAVLYSTFLLLFVPQALAQWDANSPETVAQEYMQALKQSDWSAASKLMHPEALANLKRIFVEVAEVDTSGLVAELLFGKEASPDDLTSVSPEEVYVGFMERVAQLQPQLSMIFRAMEPQIIGHVTETDSLVHVVNRIEGQIMGVEFSTMDVTSAKLHANGWRLLLSGDMRNMANTMKEQFLRNVENDLR